MAAWKKNIHRLFFCTIFKSSCFLSVLLLLKGFIHLTEIGKLFFLYISGLSNYCREGNGIHGRCRRCSPLWETAITEKLEKPGDKGSAQFCGSVRCLQISRVPLLLEETASKSHRNSRGCSDRCFEDLLGQDNFYSVFHS